MKLSISTNLIKHYLRNVYFINGHSYAGKSTMVKLLSERYDMIHCGENYNDAFPREKLSRWQQPGLCYFDTMSGWEEWLNMTPEEHWNWTQRVARECVEIEILELVTRAASGKKIIVDTNIPPDITHKRFFDRDDPDKKFMMEQIKKCKDPEKTLANFRAWFLYHPDTEMDWTHTGFFTYTRSDFETDTREEMLSALAKHFKLQNS